MKRLALAFLVMFCASHAGAWGEKGHYIVSEAATLALPPDMPHFFHRAYPELIWLAYDPDRWKGGGESIDAVNDPDHFVDYEYIAALDLPPDRYRFLALLESSGTLRRLGLTNDEIGFVPWRVAELSEKLTLLFRLWRWSTAGSPERGFIERDIINTAGILGHYVGDSANPHHATMHYNGWVGVPNTEGYANDCAIHSRFESNFVSHAVDVSQVVPKVAAPQPVSTDYFAAALGFVKSSQARIEELYRIDRDGGFDPLKPASAEGLAFATDRLAAGASMLRDIWWSAWKNSGQPRPRRAR
ncbi:MAG TPA: hypothetical protein VMS98_12550 [Thermoanaerobaculia bacterium]|nr:hypothetical protein [Thermoanaerobaculia bacterium]